jgi:hypothetical protein
MTVDQKLDLIEARPIQGARHTIPSGRMRFVVESADRNFLSRIERWAARILANRLARAEAEADAEVKYYLDPH